jgi:lysophospholipase L1-like esterase
MKTPALACALLALAACGEPMEEAIVLEPLPQDGRGYDIVELDGCAEAAADVQVSGALYEDVNMSSASRWTSEVDEEDAALAGARVELIGRRGTWSTTVCEDGTFGFAGLPEGDYFVRPVTEQDFPVCTSSTHGRRFAEALSEGELEVVVFGDSLPHWGPQPWWPERFAERAGAMADVTLHNIAVPGAESPQWLPGAGFWARDLEPLIPDADVFVFSIGGNDLYALAEADLTTTSVGELAVQFEEKVVEIEENVREIAAALRERNPDADIVYVVYPDYGNTDRWASIAGQAAPIVKNTLRRTLGRIRLDNAHYQRMTYLDLFGATIDTDLNALLVDELHFNEAGHVFVAEELFRSLGGVRVEADGEPDSVEVGLSAGEEAE